MTWWNQVSFSVRRVWIGFGERLGLRRTTVLRNLKKEVSTCEYEDVHVMWQMLGNPHNRVTSRYTASSSRKDHRRHSWGVLRWVACGAPSRFCRNYRCGH